MKKNQLFNNNNYSQSRSNYINQKSNNQNFNFYLNQPSSTIDNTNNSMTFNTPYSNNIDSFNLSKQYEDFSKTFSNQTLDNSTRDSKPVKIKNISKRAENNNNLNKKNSNSNNNRQKNQMTMQNISNSNQNRKIIQPNLNKEKNKNNLINNINDDSDESSDYGNADDDDFDNILRESINIRNTQNNLNNNSNFMNNSVANPFSGKQNILNSPTENKISVSQQLKNKKEKSNVNNKFDNNLKPQKNDMKNTINSNLNQLNPIINNETENKVYNTMNNYFNKIDLESDKKDKKLNNNDLAFNNKDPINKKKLKQRANNNNNKNLFKVDDCFNNNNIGQENIANGVDNKIGNINLNDYFENSDLNQGNQNYILNNFNNDVNNFGNNLGNNLNNINFENIDNIMPEENDINNNDINNNIKNNLLFDNKNNISNPIQKSKIDFDNPETKNQIINHNISIDNMLKEIKFLQRLKSISDERYSNFIKKYQKDIYFMEKTQFENIFIDEKNIQVKSPLTLIFHYIFNPDTLLPESGKSFFETIFTKRGDQNYSMSYDKSELLEIPKYFDNFSYVNNLFYNFNRHDLNLFLEEINSWKETFTFEQQFKHPLYMFRREKSITMKDVATVYFISPYDLIIDYHSYGFELPLSDTFVAITQYRFHCDIKFDTKKGKFIFKTSGKIFNTIKFVKETLLKKTIRHESNNTNKEELQVNTWSPLKNVIDSEDKKNQKIVDDIYEKYLMNNLNKYSKELPKEYNIFNTEDEENWDSFSDNSDKIGKINNREENLLLDWKKDLEERNIAILFYVGLFIVFLLLSKIIWSIGSGTFSFGSLFNTFIVFLLGYILIKFR